ncbi:hypothetical protein [Planctellipticum variicoloris]|uniref:hypothetical protein n=1 Tax=Planctellipticum variicoloris TaxID=3064265 RepID=UPI003013AE67|nr:hypothetical protein SH412_004848 [Planctomycetaceae bacterium SH412]
MTVIKVSSSLCRPLAKAYPSQAKNLTGGPIHIRVDDRDGDDIYPGFCDIHLKMSDPDAEEFQLILDNVPYNDDVKAVASDLDGTWQTTRTGERFVLTLPVADAGGIVRLAKAIRQVVGRGKRYLDRNWKWIAPRTAKSLERLASVVSRIRSA